MRDRSTTIAALRRLAERPGTPEEGQVARAMLEKLGGIDWVPLPFDPHEFKPGDVVYYCYWCYRNKRGMVRTRPPKMRHGQWWMLIKFDRIKQARWVPVTSELGCHISREPFKVNTEETLYLRDIDWAMKDEDFRIRCAALGISLRPWDEPMDLIQ